MFDYLQDGHTELLLEKIRGCIRSSDERLSTLCESAVGAADATAVRLSLQEACDALLGEVGALAARLCEALSRMPLPRGIFVGADDRRAVIEPLILLIPDVEAVCGRLVASQSRCLAVGERLLSCRRAEGEARMLIDAVRAVAEEEGVLLPTSMTALSERLARHRGMTDALLLACDAACEAVQALSGAQALLFFERLETVSDLKNGGVGCDPHAAVSLVRSFLKETETVMATLSEMGARLKNF